MESGPDQLPEGYVPRLGDVIATRYRLERKLGQGGMGTVFAATDLRTMRACALKVVRIDLATDDDLRRRFAREARTAAQLQVENVVAVTDLGESAGHPFLVMELLVGEDLRALLGREGKLSAPRALDLVLQACRGLEPVHDAGITHRDIKPKNLFIARHADGRDLVKVLDFGLAKRQLQPSSGTSTRTGALLGTFQYMPPEQLRGEIAGSRSDVYALGAVLYESLSGRPPFEGAEPHVLMHRIMYEIPPALETLRPGLPAAVYGLVERSLSAKSEERFADARELGQAIARVLGDPIDPEAATGRAQSTSAVAQAPVSLRSARPNRKGWMAALALTAIVLAGWWLHSQRQTFRPAMVVPAAASSLVPGRIVARAQQSASPPAPSAPIRPPTPASEPTSVAPASSNENAPALGGGASVTPPSRRAHRRPTTSSELDRHPDQLDHQNPYE